MTTADEVRERALALAEAGTEIDEGVDALLECCAGRRVSVVLARRTLLEQEDTEANTPRGRAVELLDGVLVKLPE